ncbi:MAG: ABC transporter substrate-binding protein [Terrisporobacter sp.]|uniref:ABC transporter substrate-binding protein n=1 Tax=Terrisporobacter sp. TaxID=1965305 RepID=UPI002A444CF1|nr:ABC transporter substrate-binding protein [Terrisporobacter sp.]MCI5629122.1 ABC transporter substrate-binding protein [Clostridium sp.]MCI6458138.1 ABC transporter substrate-binding protein [Clostridium sp.]MDD5877706.1 ABC transporter substrate-binding protein [Clostridiales bacterium]MDY6154285.1 ABC transporter substrate-binding protein [Terrisporobacter sp.]
MSKKLIKLLAVVLTVALGTIGCTKSNKIDDNNKNEISEYNIQESDYIHLTTIFPETINPILNTNKSVSYIMNLIYDGLFEMDENYNVEPRLVEKYTLSSDGKSIRIKLASDATWHNKKEVTSSDVSYTVDLIKKNSKSPYVALVDNIQSIHISDSKNFTIKLKENDPFAIDKLTFPIVSKDKLSSLNTSQIGEYKNNLLGNGPYKIKKYEDRQYIILERNEDYFGDLPENRKEIYVKMVPDKESQTEMVLALDSDIANISLEELSKFENKKEFNITKYEGRDYEMVIFNYDNEFLNNVNFRKAIISSIDREKLLNEAYVDNADLSNFPLNTKNKYYNNDIKNISYDKEKALNYLASGLKSVSKSQEEKQSEDSQGSSENVEGIIEDNLSGSSTEGELSKQEIKQILNNIELSIIVSSDNGERVKVAHTISQDLSSIGVKSSVKELNNEDLKKALDSKDYDLAVVGYSLSSVPDARGILEACGIKDKKLSTYIESLGKSTSESETKKIYNQIQKYVVEKASFISLGILDDFIVSNKRLKGTINPNEFDIYKGISNLQMSK